MAADPMLVKSAIRLPSPEAPGGARTAERAIWEAAATVADSLKALGLPAILPAPGVDVAQAQKLATAALAAPSASAARQAVRA